MPEHFKFGDIEFTAEIGSGEGGESAKYRILFANAIAEITAGRRTELYSSEEADGDEEVAEMMNKTLVPGTPMSRGALAEQLAAREELQDQLPRLENGEVDIEALKAGL